MLPREFHEAFGLPVSDVPTASDWETLVLRTRLIKEETEEVTHALARLAYADDDLEERRELISVAKELADLRYVVEGTAVSLGIPLDDVYALVHKSNMSKLGEDGKPVRREDGKVLKGPHYCEPEPAIRQLLHARRKQAQSHQS